MILSMKKIIFLFPILCFCYSCTDRITIDTKDAEARLSVFGYLTPDKMRHSIKITRTAGYFSSNQPEGISDAIVTISDGTNIFPLFELPDSAGLYLTDFIWGIEGKTYTLNISLDFDNDGILENFQATSTMPYSTHIDSILITSIPPLPFPYLLLYGTIPLFQQNMMGLYVYKNRDIVSILNYFMIIPDYYFKPGENGEIDGVEFPFFHEKGVLENDTIFFLVRSFESNFSTFLSQAYSAGASNPIFGGPSADVITNIVALDSEIQTVGFFSTFSQSVKSVIADKDYLVMPESQ